MGMGKLDLFSARPANCPEAAFQCLRGRGMAGRGTIDCPSMQATLMLKDDFKSSQFTYLLNLPLSFPKPGIFHTSDGK